MEFVGAGVDEGRTHPSVQSANLSTLVRAALLEALRTVQEFQPLREGWQRLGINIFSMTHARIQLRRIFFTKLRMKLAWDLHCRRDRI